MTPSTKDDKQELRYSAKITGTADGRLDIRRRGEAVTDFVTNRTGFVVLHPIAGVAGAPATVEEVDGKIVETNFPELISPGQPIFNIRAITHEFAPGAKVVCRMEGDIFEMEDQRNWMDASYKTYVRPLAMPWPYTSEGGRALEQKSNARASKEAPKPQSAGAGGNRGQGRWEDRQTCRRWASALRPEDAAPALAKADMLAQGQAGLCRLPLRHASRPRPEALRAWSRSPRRSRPSPGSKRS